MTPYTTFDNNSRDCSYTYYYLKLKVTDDAETSDAPDMNTIPVLYVSSRDHMLPGKDAKMDYAVSAASYAINQGDKFDAFTFGERRGMGWESPNIDNKYWYSYDEFITNGGFEVVEVESIDTKFLQIGEFPYVPVQSEADIMILHGEGATKESISTWAAPVSGLFGFSYPMYDYVDSFSSSQKNEWEANQELFLAYKIQGTRYFEGSHCPLPGNYCNRYSDFKTISAGYHTYGWGEFWKKVSGELRWLVLLGCEGVSGKGDPGEQPDFTWKTVINDGYLSSVCGFSETVRPEQEDQDAPDGTKFYLSDGVFMSKFSDNLADLYTEAGDFEVNYQVSINDSFWFGCDEGGCDSGNHRPRDLSVAAYMEAACELVGFEKGYRAYSYSKLHTAKAIDYDHIDGVTYSWKIYKRDPEEHYQFNNKNYNRKICRGTL